MAPYQWRKFMSSVADLKTQIGSLTDTINALSSKFDAVAALVASLKSAGVATQADLDNLSALVTDAQNSAAALGAKEDSVLPPAA